MKYLQLLPLSHTVIFHFLCLILHLISDLFDQKSTSRKFNPAEQGLTICIYIFSLKLLE